MNINKDGALKLFREIVHQMFSTGDTRLIQNDSKNYACVLISELLKSATREVLIFCNHFNLDIWCDRDVLEGLKYALSNGVKVDVLLQNEPEDQECNLTYKLLCEYPNGVVNVISGKNMVENFIVADYMAYYLEQDNRTHKGFACANDSEHALILIQVFDNLKSSKLETTNKEDKQ